MCSRSVGAGALKLMTAICNKISCDDNRAVTGPLPQEKRKSFAWFADLQFVAVNFIFGLFFGTSLLTILSTGTANSLRCLREKERGSLQFFFS